MHGTGRVRSGVGSIQLLHLRFFIYCCHVPSPATASAEGAQLNGRPSPCLDHRCSALVPCHPLCHQAWGGGKKYPSNSTFKCTNKSLFHARDASKASCRSPHSACKRRAKAVCAILIAPTINCGGTFPPGPKARWLCDRLTAKR